MINFRQNYPQLDGQAALLRNYLKQASEELTEEALAMPAWEGRQADRDVAAQWLTLPPTQRALICSSGNHALLVTALTLNLAGKTVVTETYTYNAFKTLAASLGIGLLACETDEDGLVPASLQACCRTHPVAAIYVQPTIQNPTCATMPRARRQAVADIATQHGVPIIEDDAYRFLHENPPPRFADLAPALTFYIASLTKPFSPILKVAYLCLPESLQEQATAMLRLTASGSSTLLAHLASAMISTGDLDRLIEEKRMEARRRQLLAAQVLKPLSYRTHPNSFHLWLPLPPSVSAEALQRELLQKQVDISNGIEFAASETHSAQAIRISLGAVTDRETLRTGLLHIRQSIANRLDAALPPLDHALCE